MEMARPQPVGPIEDTGFDSAGVWIRYFAAGAGEPVVLIHGFIEDAERQWLRPGVVAALARRYRVYAMDARGHGKSAKPHTPAAYGPEMACDVVRLLGHLGHATAHLVGYSMGAHIIAQLLTLNPARVASAVLGGASGRRNWSAADQRLLEIEAAELEQGSLRSQLLRLWPSGRPPPSEAELARRSAYALAGHDPRALAAVRRSNPAQVVTEAQMAAVLVPVRGIVGTRDPYLAEFCALRVVMPQLDLVTIEGGTHGTTPARRDFLRAVEKHLAAHPIG